MRTLVIGIGLSAALAWGTSAMAQSPGQQAYEKDEMRSAVHQLTPAERVHERAAIEGRARLNRIEARHALGVSPQRPLQYLWPIPQQPSVYVPWGVYGAIPIPYTVCIP